jgi:ribonuclease P/MRP protein subunit RPP1
MTNTREIIRITSGKGVIFSSGPGGSVDGLRGPLDVVNL